MTSTKASPKVYEYPFDKSYRNGQLIEEPFDRKPKDRQERIILRILKLTDNLIDNKQIYDYNGPDDIWSKIWENEDWQKTWGTERTSFGFLRFFITHVNLTLYEIFILFPYQFTYGDFKRIKDEFPGIINGSQWARFNHTLTQKDRCANNKELNKELKINLNCKLNIEDEFVNEPELYSGGSRTIKKSKNLKKHLHKIRRSKNKSF
jgi:hypothetical protein